MRGFFRKKNKSPHSKDAAKTGSAGGKTVLVVDDSPTERLIFTNTLIKAGFSVETASAGEEGVRAAQQLHPDLILMDVVMPVLTGFQATRQLQHNDATAHIPIIMVTSYAMSGDERKAMLAGCDAYIPKPFSPLKLLERIKEYVP